MIQPVLFYFLKMIFTGFIQGYTKKQMKTLLKKNIGKFHSASKPEDFFHTEVT